MTEVNFSMMKIQGRNVQITFQKGINRDHVEKALAHGPFQDWKESMNSEKEYELSKIFVQSVDMFGPKKVGFIKFKATITDKDGMFVPGIVFMRGGAVSILVILECEGIEYTIITLQPRVATGNFCFPELPAGMLDGSGNFSGVAADEMRDETGIDITSDKLFDMTEAIYGKDSEFRGVYPSAGGCDEFVRIFLYRKKVSREELEGFRGKLTGERELGEKITLMIIPLARLPWYTPDVKALSAFALINCLKMSV
jgi:ADP-sugar diphosphatase